jgi:hypothetical protein
MAKAEIEKSAVVYVEVIPHKQQRYRTCGDWLLLPHGIHISVSDTGDEVSNMLVAIHELVESFLCKVDGVSGKDVDDFDVAFEAGRTEESLDEPGDDPSAPYNVQHRVADVVERLVALHAGVNWQEHEKRIEALG